MILCAVMEAFVLATRNSFLSPSTPSFAEKYFRRKRLAVKDAPFRIGPSFKAKEYSLKSRESFVDVSETSYDRIVDSMIMQLLFFLHHFLFFDWIIVGLFGRRRFGLFLAVCPLFQRHFD